MRIKHLFHCCQLLTIGTSLDIDYDLVVKTESALMTFSCEFDGKTVGSVEAIYKT